MTVFIKKDVFKEHQIESIEEEIEHLRPQFTRHYLKDSALHRIDLDKVYGKERYLSATLSTLPMIFEEFKKEVANIEEFSYQRLSFTYSYSTNISESRDYKINAYPWHRDSTPAAPSVFMTYIIYLNDDFGGGVLQYKDHGKIIDVKPERNKLVLIPSHIYHHVTDTIYNDKTNFRMTVGGSIFT